MNEPEPVEFETLLQDTELILSRCRTELTLMMTAASTSVEVATRFEHFYSLREDLDTAWAVRPTTLRHSDGLSVLIAHDPGGQPLASLLGAPLELPMLLRIAIGVASAL